MLFSHGLKENAASAFRHAAMVRNRTVMQDTVWIFMGQPEHFRFTEPVIQIFLNISHKCCPDIRAMCIACYTGNQSVCQQELRGMVCMPAEPAQRTAFVDLGQTAQL